MDEDEDDTFGAAWDKLSDAAAAAPEGGASAGAEASAVEQVIEMGPPIRVTIVVRSETIPVAPWAQGWNIGAIGPNEGMITMLFEHDVDHSPVAQLAAITGLLGTVKAAQLDVVWWAMQTRGPLPGEEPEPGPDLEQELSDFLITEEQKRSAETDDPDTQ